MSRFDKYSGVTGGFRAKLTAAIAAVDVGKIQAVSILAGTGRVIIGGPAETAVIGLICPVRAMAIGEPIDVMTHGEIVECLTTAGAAFAAGALVYAHLAGTVDSVSAAGKTIGKMIELDRMIVRVTPATT